MFDLSRLGDWADLPFFSDQWAHVAKQLSAEILPPPALTFAALERTQHAQTKVVIIGQDPYHTPGKADGLAFSIPSGFGGRLDSLGNIFKELGTDIGVERTKTSLDDWADQGVLLLNTALSVPAGKPKAHAKLGWSALVHDVLQALADQPCVFILWGGPAQTYASSITGNHLILSSAHPSPLSVYRGFFGSRPFSRANQWLIEQGQEPINWADP